MYNKQGRNVLTFLISNKLILAAIVGLAFALIFSFNAGTEKNNPSNSLKEPASSPYEHNIAGVGIVEASSGNINLGSFNPGIVHEVLVKEGDEIKKGDTLFIQDQRSAKASFVAAINELEMAKKELEMSKIESQEQKDKYKRAKGLKATSNISEESYQGRKFTSQRADMDVILKENKVSAAKQKVELAQIALDQTSIESPIDGIVLKVRIRPGEFISGAEQDDNAPMLIGSHRPLYIKVKVDENDMWRFNEKLQAFAFLRSNQTIKTPLKFIRIEPYASKKEQLRGSGIELIDTRIINIVYEIKENLNRFYIGQQLDVFIESSEGP